MTHIVTDYEMSRQKLMADAKMAVLKALTPFTGEDNEHGLTIFETVSVLGQIQMALLKHGLNLEWKEELPQVEADK